ncbi:MAG TPA: hypothetical protein VEL75_18450 [Candidatus Methylomirabilis sp.]|nr:hypothetical protein [Gemmatimonadales bacterium]HYB43766.1 hypothetical protein [Candidatus Methylomirabilis sp.]
MQQGIPPQVFVDPAQIVAVLGAIVVMGFVVLGPIGRAFAERLRGKAARDRALDTGEVEALREDLLSLRRHVEELAERQDFTERLLAQAREQGRLQAPNDR